MQLFNRRDAMYTSLFLFSSKSSIGLFALCCYTAILSTTISVGNPLQEGGSQCNPGYWADPSKGGECQICDCNGNPCHSETGECICTTKGVVGDHCEKCQVGYTEDKPNKGSCFYELLYNFVYVFNLGKQEDILYTRINMRSTPIAIGTDTVLTINCTEPAKMNITMKTENSIDEKPIFLELNATSAKFPIKTEDDAAKATYSVYVYDFKPPLQIRASFAPH